MMIIKNLVVGPLSSNCYIVGSEASKEGMIIDPGDEAEVILRNVRDLGLDKKYEDDIIIISNLLGSRSRS